MRIVIGVLQVLDWAASFATPLTVLVMLGKFLERREGWLRLVLRYAAAWVMCNNVIYFGDYVNILYALPAVFLLIRLGWRCRGAAWLTVSMLIYTMVSTLAAITDALYTLSYIVPEGIRFYVALLGNHYLTRGIVLTLAMLALRRLLPRKRYVVSERVWRLMRLLSLLPFVGILASVALVNPYYESLLPGAIGTGMLPLLVMLPLFFFTSLALLYTATVLGNHEQLEREAALARMSQTYYTQLEQQQQSLRRLRHDMANHLTVLSGLLEGGKQAEAELYLAGLQAASGVSAGRRYCENAVVNTVLSAKAAAMEEQGIRFAAQATVPEQVNVEGPDLCALLGNALDNAMEACAALPAERREVRLSLRADRGLLALRVVNPCEQAPKREGKRLLSGKKDPENHGLGTESIRGIAEKYGGSADFTVKDGQFECMLYLPLA